MNEDDLVLEPDDLKGLSFTKISTFLRCQYQYYFRYCLGIKAIPQLKMIIGHCFHKAISYGLGKMISKETPKANEVKDFAVFDYETTMMKTVADLDEFDMSIEIGKDDTAKLSEISFEQYASKTNPIATERKFEIDIAGEKVTGFIDEEEETKNGKLSILEYKTTTRRPIPFAAFDPQTSLYGETNPNAITILKKIYIVRHKNKSRSISILEYAKAPDSEETKKDTANMVRNSAIAIKSAMINGFVKTTDLKICSWCGYRRLCRPEIFEHEGNIEKIITTNTILEGIKPKKQKETENGK